jgi:hypothetical protein
MNARAVAPANVIPEQTESFLRNLMACAETTDVKMRCPKDISRRWIKLVSAFDIASVFQ